MDIREQLVASREKTYDGINPCLGVLVHETANTRRGANAAAHANLQSQGNVRNASWHVSADDTEAVRSFTDDVQCWHAGDGRGPGNLTKLAVEICVNEDGDYDKALANGAAVVRDWRIKHGIPRSAVGQHHDVTGKDCPKILRSRGAAAWEAFLDMTEPKSKPGGIVKPYFVSPAVGRVSSPWGYRERHPVTGKRGFHRGLDIAPHDRNAPPQQVWAAYGGVVVGVWNPSGPGKDGKWAGNPYTKTWNTGPLVIVKGPKGGCELYGHLDQIFVKIGDVVEPGDVIGIMGDKGNVTGRHLHFETWDTDEQGGGLAGGNTHNPMADFARWGVKVGSQPKTTAKPLPKPPVKKPTKADPTVLKWQRVLKKLGYYAGALDGIAGSYWRAGVNAYIRSQRYAPRLVADGVFGPAAQAHYAWTRRLQAAMNGWKGRDVPVDGDLGRNTMGRVLDVMRRNHGGTYRGALDGVPGPVFCKMIGIPPHPGV